MNPETVPLNHSEKLYLALEGMLGSVSQVYAVRFDGPVHAHAARDAFRALVRSRPRLRTRVERTVTGHRLRVRPVDDGIERLIEHAFEIAPSGPTDDPSVPSQLERMLGQPFGVERDLPVKARFVPHPRHPMLLLAFHHIAGDGRSIVGWLSDLVAHLNGGDIAPHELDPPSYWPALRPRGLMGWLRALGTWFTRRRPRAALRLSRRPIEHFPPTRVTLKPLSIPARELSRTAKRLGVTVGALMFAAVAVAMRRVRPNDESPVRARMSIDLRRLFGDQQPGDGNYVSSFVASVSSTESADILAEAPRSMQAAIASFDARREFFPKLLDSLSTLLGRKLFGMAALAAYRRDRVAPQSVMLSNLGRIDAINQHANAVRVDVVHPSLTVADLFMGITSMGGCVRLTALHPDGAIDGDEVRRMVQAVEDVLVEWAETPPLALAPAPAPTAAPALSPQPAA